MEAGCPGRWAGSFAEIGIRLIVYAKNCLGKRAHKTECAYVIPARHMTEKEFWKEFLCLLTLTKQFCTVNGHKSRIEEVICGILQGSCLGPLLFIKYLINFESCLEFSKANMYADDTHATISSSNIAELIRMTKKLLNVSDWLRVDKLSANPQKTEFMVIGHQRGVNEIQELPSLKLNDSEIKRVGKVKSLGIIVDEGLAWNDQLKSLTGKLAAGLSSLKKLQNVLPQSKLYDVYRALIESHQSHGSVVWGSLSSAELQTLQHLQNRALSIIASARYKDPRPKNWLNGENLILFDQSILVYKILDKLCTENFWNMFQLRPSLSNCNTRNYKDIHIPMLKLESTKRDFKMLVLRH